ncbi:MAG: hypothetical protein ACLSHG_00770 [Oscillospiraceae bacterium]
MNQTFQKIVGGVLAVTVLMGLSACGSKTEDNKADGKTYKVGIVQFVDDASSTRSRRPSRPSSTRRPRSWA